MRFRYWLNVINPLAWRRWLRQSMTAASVTLMLAGIVSLNILWGYPWLGLFSASLSMFGVGLLVNRVFRPSLKFRTIAPVWTSAGERTELEVQFRNRRVVPAMDLVLKLDSPDTQGTRVPFLAPHDQASFTCQTIFPDRGIVSLPALQMDSYFPFHLFRHVQRLASSDTIAVAPRRIDPQNDPVAEEVARVVGSVAQRALQSDSNSYLGSREYEPGMPVRRWDFASWARLGKPILREFGSAKVQTIRLIVDTANPDPTTVQERPTGWRPGRDRRLGRTRKSKSESLEHLLSVAALAVETISQRGTGLQFYVTEPIGDAVDSEQTPIVVAGRGISCPPGTEWAHPMVRLAAAESIEAETADHFLAAMEPHSNGCRTMVLSRRIHPPEQIAWVAHPTLWITTSPQEPHPSSTSDSTAPEFSKVGMQS